MCNYICLLQSSFPNLDVAVYDELNGRLTAQYHRGYQELGWSYNNVRDSLEPYVRSIYPFDTDRWLNRLVLECQLAYFDGERQKDFGSFEI